MIEIKYRWEDCSIGFICPYCGAELSADSQSGEEECDCGLKYRLVVSLKIDASNAKHSEHPGYAGDLPGEGGGDGSYYEG